MGVELSQGLNQQQVLSPQMRQGLELLHTSSLELSQLVQQALEINPVLEQISTETSIDSEIEEAESNEDSEASMLSEMADDFREEMITTRKNQSSGPDQDYIDYFYNSIVAPKTLQQHLLNQLNLAGKPPAVYTVVEIIIGSLNDKGFLTEDLIDIANREHIAENKLRSACAIVQSFEPAGVGARNITESLLIQLNQKNIDLKLEKKIVEFHLKDLSHRRFPEIAKSIGVSLTAVTEAAENIAKLNPNPGADFDPTHNPQIQPDIIISMNSEDKLQAHLTDAYIPSIIINENYKDLLATTPDSEVRKYLKENIRDGRTLIRSVSQRQETLLKIAEVLMDRQKDFFYQGPKALLPLTMNELAEKIGVHPTTVSRACTTKYILTPLGIFELRYFFTTGIENQDGKNHSNTSIRDTIKELIEKEDPKKPHSDSAIENLLQDQGITVARRTVAKYRDQLGILSSTLRKKF